MEVRNITNDGNTKYDPFLIDALNIAKPQATASTSKASEQTSESKVSWQNDILLSALDKLENKIQVDDKSHPLGGLDNAPIETYGEALIELEALVNDNFKEYASQAQANLTPQDILYLFEDTYDFVI